MRITNESGILTCLFKLSSYVATFGCKLCILYSFQYTEIIATDLVALQKCCLAFCSKFYCQIAVAITVYSHISWTDRTVIVQYGGSKD